MNERIMSSSEQIRTVLRGRGNRQSLVNLPSLAEAVRNGLRCQPSQSGPFSDALSLAAKCQISIPARVVCLFQSCRPSTVLWRIAERIVFALKLVIWRWARPHVFVEIREVSHPSFAHCDSSTAVTTEGVMRGICAANNHVSVKHIFRRFIQAVTIQACPELAPTTSDLALTEGGTGDEFFGTAFASATPQDDTPVALIGWFNRCQSAKDSTAKIVLNVAVRSLDHPEIIGVFA
jgi:hypothetical protein